MNPDPSTPPPDAPAPTPPGASAPLPQPLASFIELCLACLRDDSFVRLVLSAPAPPGTPPRFPPPRAVGRLVHLRDHPTLSLDLSHQGRQSTHNLLLDDVPAWLSSTLSPPSIFTSARLESTRRDWQLAASPNRPPRLIPHPPRSTQSPPRSHDRPKSRALQPSAHDWLHALGLTDPAGTPKPSRADKFHQILRFTEVLGHLLDELPLLAAKPPDPASAPTSAPTSAPPDVAPDSPVPVPLQVLDLACGRGYLTFAAWQLLHRQRRLPVHVTGTERRADLVQEALETTRRLHLSHLEFTAASISDCHPRPVDLLLALHACNTATDDALLLGIRSGARLMLVSPCCHQQLRPQLQPAPPFERILRQGTLAERFSEWLTDGLRVLFLEWAGYRVKTIEFIPSEHTPKNLLIAAIRDRPPFQDLRSRDQILDLKSRFGIAAFALDPLLDAPANTPPSAHARLP